MGSAGRRLIYFNRTMDEPPTTPRCPACGAALQAGDGACAACGRNEANPFRPPITKDAPPPRGWPGPAYAIGVASIALALVWPMPGLAVAWVIIATPALMGAAVVIRRRRMAGLPTGTAERATALFASVVATLLAIIAASIAFVAVCFPIGLFAFDLPGKGERESYGFGMISAFVLGGIAGLAAGFYLFKVLWPRTPQRLGRPKEKPSGDEQRTNVPPPEGLA
jgi:hypothetical protein